MFFKLPVSVCDTREKRACPCSAPVWVGSPTSQDSSQYSDFRVKPTAEPKSSGSDLSWLAGGPPPSPPPPYPGWQVFLLTCSKSLLSSCSLANLTSADLREPWSESTWRKTQLQNWKLSSTRPRRQRWSWYEETMILQEKNKQTPTEYNLQKRRWTERASSSGFELHDGQRKRSASFNTQQGKDVF